MEASLDVTKIDNKEILIVGGTGFVSNSLLGKLFQLSSIHNLNINVHLVSRNLPTKMPQSHLFKTNWLQWDNFFVNSRIKDEITDVLFLANYNSKEQYEKRNLEFSLRMAENIGKLVSLKERKPRVFYASSGAVYGSDARFGVSEDEVPRGIISSYGKGKLYAEEILASYSSEFNFSLIIGRLFSFFGPGLPLNSNYIIGNLMQSALKGSPFIFRSTGESIRSYMSSDELGFRLTQLLGSDFEGRLNIGGSIGLKLKSVWEIFNERWNFKTVHLDPLDTRKTIYVPDCSKLTSIFGRYKTQNLASEIENWHQVELARRVSD